MVPQDDSNVQVKEILKRLQSPIPDFETLASVLAAPLDTLNLLPPRLRRYRISPLPPSAKFSVLKHIGQIQRTLLEQIAPTWWPILCDESVELLLDQYFCPDSFFYALPTTGNIVLHAYSTILSIPLGEYSTLQLVRLSTAYPLDRLYAAAFHNETGSTHSRQSAIWEDCVRNFSAVPAKVANALGPSGAIPPELEHSRYFTNVSTRLEVLLFELSGTQYEEKLPSLSFLVTKLVNVGLFPPTRPSSYSQISFFELTLPVIRTRFQSESERTYSRMWTDLVTSLPAFLLQSVLASLLSSLDQTTLGLDPSTKARGLIKREANLIRKIVGRLDSDSVERWEAAFAVLLNRESSHCRGRIFTCWVAASSDPAQKDIALDILLSRIVDTWSTPEHINHSLLPRHQYMTALLLTVVSYFPANHPSINALSLSSPFISAVGAYISHIDNAVRRCGMLAAELVAQRSGKKLDFGDWDGEGAGRDWARQVRKLIESRDCDVDEADSEPILSSTIALEAPLPNPDRLTPGKPNVPQSVAEQDSDDESLVGYAESLPSSRSPSPTPSELDEIEKDPTLRIGHKKVRRPVYLAELGNMLRGSMKPDDREEVDKIDMALNSAEELIRRKRGFGTELEENAVNLVYGLVALQDNFELEGFDANRQNALTALIACSPRKAAPAVIEQFFKNQYSTSQRFVMLNALALGAREMAGLPVSSGVPSSKYLDFPSKQLPPALHKKYLTQADQGGLVQELLAGISRQAIDRAKDIAEDRVPELVRERQLRIRKAAKVTEVSSGTKPLASYSHPRTIAFTEIAAEFFIAPLIGHFWLFLRDEQAREERTSRHERSYRGAGTGMILNALVLAQFLSTVGVLMHFARNTPAYLAVLAPDALELAVTLGTRPVSLPEEGDSEGKEASVLTTSLELALVVLDGCLELDGGRSLGLEHTTLLQGAGAWAGEVFGQLENGVLVRGGGGQDVRLRRAAAGVVLKVDELTSRWGRSMISS